MNNMEKLNGSEIPQATPATEENLPDYFYYNVMPKDQGNSLLVSPSIKMINTDNQSAHEPNKITAVLVSNKKWFLFGIIAFILGVAAYFIVPAIMPKEKNENFLITQSNFPNASSTQQTSNPNSTTAPEQLLSSEWLSKYFNQNPCAETNLCSPESDPDKDGMSNMEEYRSGTDPNNNDSDNDGIADGDELHIFYSNPLAIKTVENRPYEDKSYVIYGYNFTGDYHKLTSEEIEQLRTRMLRFNLHEPTWATLGSAVKDLYNFSDIPPSSNTSTSVSVEQTPEAKQERDAQRNLAIKSIAIALTKYFDDNKTYPKNIDFSSMYALVKAYIRTANNPLDPVNREPYLYKYSAESSGANFILSFYSETQNTEIKIRAADALKYRQNEEASALDERRKIDLESIRSALLLYSNKNANNNSDYVFPHVEKYKTEIVPEFLTALPKDPKTNLDYEYKTSELFNTFTIKTILDNPPAGTTGFVCNQEECNVY